jgi:putative nucleotidyltransferase with HDIG domain
VNKFLNEFLKYIIIAGTLLIISLFCPKREMFHYQYSKGEIWNYETLRAPFNFPILRNEAEIETEKNSIKNNFIPRFRKSPGIGNELVLYIDNISFDSITSDDLARIKSLLKREITSIYSMGVLNNEDYKKIKSDYILLTINDRTIKRSFVDLYTPEKANQRIKKTINENLGINLAEIGILNFIPDCIYDNEINNRLLQEMVDNVSVNSGVFKKSDIIIGKGEVITQSKLLLLDSFRDSFLDQVGNGNSQLQSYIAYFILIFLIIAIIILYLTRNKKEIFNNPVSLLFIMMWIIIFSYAIYFLDAHGERFIYAIPFVIAPIIVINFFDKNLALALHIVIILIASLITKLGYEFTVLQLVVGIIAVMLFAELRFWNKFFINITIIFLIYVVGYISLSVINYGSLGEVQWNILISFFFNALLILLAYPLIPLLEQPFGFVSKITLTELGDFNKPLLKELSVKAPGTLQHSIQVGILAEAATEKIGGNTLLVKIGALYHDIGKVYAPEFFIENQRLGENPYEGLDNFTSALKIIDHVRIGEKMAIKNHLPKVLQRFIVTHHGTTRVEYFCIKQMNEFPDKQFDESIFRYLGPKPYSKEETIFMLADSLEATAKSMIKPTDKDINDLVEKITKSKIEGGQFDESQLSFKELIIVKQTLKETLKNIHHVRISYPELNR